MRLTIRRILAMLAVLAAVALWRTLVIVDQSESAFVTEFGRPVRLIEEAGLHFKWPQQGVRSFDRRLQLDAPPAREMLTKDKKNLQVAWYASWRIADVVRFLRTVRTMPDASARLEDMAAAVLAAELGGHELGQLVSIGETSMLDALASELTRRVANQAAQEYGVEVVAVRLLRLNYPEEVRTAVFEQIRSERQRVAAATRRRRRKPGPYHPECGRPRPRDSHRPGRVRRRPAHRRRGSAGGPDRQRGSGRRSCVLPVPQDARDLPRGPRRPDHSGPLGG